jgi:hypothetical protein
MENSRQLRREVSVLVASARKNGDWKTASGPSAHDFGKF